MIILTKISAGFVLIVKIATSNWLDCSTFPTHKIEDINTWAFTQRYSCDLPSSG